MGLGDTGASTASRRRHPRGNRQLSWGVRRIGQHALILQTVGRANALAKFKISVLVIAFALTCACNEVVSGAPGVGVEMPLAGIDGGDGWAAVEAIKLVFSSAAVKDSSRGGHQNPHEDEGADNDVDLEQGPKIIADFGADPSIGSAVGGLRRAVGDADTIAARRSKLPTIVLHRRRDFDSNGFAFCLCASPAALARYAETQSKALFGTRMLTVIVSSSTERSVVPPSLHRRTTMLLTGPDVAPATATTARRFDSILLIAQDRTPILFDAKRFAKIVDGPYARALYHRDAMIVPTGTPSRAFRYLSLHTPAPEDVQGFSKRFHEVAGFAPTADARAAYAAAQILREAGGTRADVLRALRTNIFHTIIGNVRFAADGYLDDPAFDTTSRQVP